MKRTDRKAYERASKRDRVMGGIISFVVVVLVGGLLISIFTAQQRHRQTFDEQTIEQTSKKKTSVEKRIESERSSVERINDSLDTAESVREPAQNSEAVGVGASAPTDRDIEAKRRVNVSETSQAETTGTVENNESMGSQMGSSWTKEDMQPSESSEAKKEFSKEEFSKEEKETPKKLERATGDVEDPYYKDGGIE